MGVFKAYDIRGIYPTELDEDFAYKLGRAMVVFLGTKTLIVGHDVRQSSPQLHKKFIEGATDQGCDVQDMGACSTNMLFFAARRSDAVMVTASHTPKEYNGFKPCRKGAIPIGSDSGLLEVEKIVKKGNFPKAKKGKVTTLRLLDDFIEDVASYCNSVKGLKVVVDAGNGAEGIAMPSLAKRLGINLIPLFFEQDGSFPGRGPNPLMPNAMEPLRKKVVDAKADFGVAYDADCDRVFFIDEKGAIIPADLLLGLIAEQLLKKQPGSTILYDLRSSWSVREHIKDLGGNPLITRVGHSFIKEKMRETKAIFAGELSGHYYYASNSYADSGDITFVLMLGLIASTGKKLSALTKSLRKYFASGEINFTVKDKDAIMGALKKKYANGKLSELDGVSVEFDDWWFNARASNTEPLLRLNVEAKKKDVLQKRLEEITAVIKRD